MAALTISETMNEAELQAQLTKELEYATDFVKLWETEKQDLEELINKSTEDINTFERMKFKEEQQQHLNPSSPRNISPRTKSTGPTNRKKPPKVNSRDISVDDRSSLGLDVADVFHDAARIQKCEKEKSELQAKLQILQQERIHEKEELVRTIEEQLKSDKGLFDIQKLLDDQKEKLSHDIGILKQEHQDEILKLKLTTEETENRLKSEIDQLKTMESKHIQNLENSYQSLQKEIKNNEKMEKQIDDLNKVLESQNFLLNEKNNDIEKRNKEVEELRKSGASLELLKAKEETIMALKNNLEFLNKDKDQSELRFKELKNEKENVDIELKQKKLQFDNVINKMAQTIDKISQDTDVMRNQLTDLTKMNELQNGCPRVFELSAITKTWKYTPHHFMTTSFRLRFLCAYDFTPCECGDDKKGYVIEISNEFAKKIAPAIKCTAAIMKILSIAGKVASGLELPIPDMGGVMDSAESAKVKWDFISSNWPSDTNGDTNGLSDTQEKVENQAYIELNDQIRKLDSNLSQLDMKLATSKYGVVKWVKKSNVEKFEKSNKVTRFDPVNLSTKDEINLHKDATEVFGGQRAKDAHNKFIEKSNQSKVVSAFKTSVKKINIINNKKK